MIAVDLFFCLMLALLIVMMFWFWCGSVCHKERMDIIHRWGQLTEGAREAVSEFDQVSYGQHSLATMLFRDRSKMYGPITQEIWSLSDQDIARLHLSEFWWRCYNEAYLILPPGLRIYINRTYAPGYHLPMSLSHIGIDVTRFDSACDDPSPMIAAAEEYEQAMAAQDAMEHML